ncbi:hypothetical protein S40288_00551 [Stachybotrys chartarum IBT 40288]|nr:hypothetical protein S40288_00551 [Stachybotrys chartarum IBT 40288]
MSWPADFWGPLLPLLLGNPMTHLNNSPSRSTTYERNTTPDSAILSFQARPYESFDTVMIAPRFVASLALRQAQCLAIRQASTSRLAFYHSYSMPTTESSTSTAAPRNDDVPETSITMPPPSNKPVPEVHETRPPPGTSPPPPQAAEQAPQTQKPAPSSRPRSTLRRPRKAAMKLTPAAVEQLRSLLEGPEPKLIKVGVRNRGCSGLAYHLEYVDKPGAFDELIEQDGVKVLVDSKALFSIIGSEMDWKEDKLNQRFVFHNPNIKEELHSIASNQDQSLPGTMAITKKQKPHTVKNARPNTLSTTANPVVSTTSTDPQLALISASQRTAFEKRVWTALCQIPRGSVTTYGLLAAHLGTSPRAVGNALRRNPFAPAVPCHRVVATGGTLGGFKGSWPRDGEGITITEKKKLLKEEGVRLDVEGLRVLGTPWAGWNRVTANE